MLTAAVRDLHRCYPGRFLTDVRTSCPALWLHNPYITPLDEKDARVEIVDCGYPLINQSNNAPFHCVHGFVHFLNERLGLCIQPRDFGGDIHLSREEKSAPSQVEELAGARFPFWLIVSGGKFDYTIKWWDPNRFQSVVDHFRDRVQFVQIGEIGHHHPRLRGTIDLRGRTDLRELIRLVHHAQGVLCGVTALMHLAAAVETYSTRPKLRPAVIIAGGREPTHWEAYPHHQFIHTVGALPCCETGGCWRSRVRPLGDGEKHDLDRNLCANVVGALPKCMDMISVQDVIRRIENFFTGGMTRYLKRGEIAAARRSVLASEQPPTFDSTLNIITAPGALREVLKRRTPPPPAMCGRGVVICSAGDELVAIARAARRRAPDLPLRCCTNKPLSQPQRRELALLRAEAHEVQPERSLMIEALLNTPWREVVVLTQAHSPLGRKGIEESFASETFERTGVLFWMRPKSRVRSALWRLCGLEPPAASIHPGCVVIDRQRCWRALQAWEWLCEHRYLFVEAFGSEAASLHFAVQMIGQHGAASARGISGKRNARTISQPDIR